MEEERYVLTPKGLALEAMLQTGLVTSADDPRVDGFWTIFEASMKRCGYVQTEKVERR